MNTKEQIDTNVKSSVIETSMQAEDVFDDSEYYKRLAKAKAKAKEWMTLNPKDLLFEVTSRKNTKVLSILPDDVLVELFDRLPPLTTEEAYEELGHFKTLPNGMFTHQHQNLMLETLLKARRLSLNSSTCTNNKSTKNETFLLVEALFDGVGEEEQGFTTPNDYPSPSILEHDDNTDGLSFNSSICTNNKTTENQTFVQVSLKKWTLQQNLFHPESIAYLITNECWARIKKTKDEMEDVISDALVQYYELEANGEIDYEKAAQYWVRTAVNKTINKYKFDKADKRREVETAAEAEPEQLKHVETYDNLDSWYQSLTKSQKSAVDDAKYKIEKGKEIGPALKKRLSRVPKPVWGEIERNYGTSSLRDEHAELRYEHERVKSNKEEKELLKQVKKKRKTSTLKLKINAAGQNGQSQTPIPASLEQISEPQSAEGYEYIPNDPQKPTATNMNDLRTQWEELVEDQLSIDINNLEEYQVKYKLDYYEDCLIIPQEFEKSLQELGIDANNYKEIHKTLCLDTVKETIEVA